MQVARRSTNELAALLLSKKCGQSAQQAQQQSQCLFSHLIGEKPCRAADRYGRFYNAWYEAVVEACGRTLDEFQASLLYDVVPRYWHFCVTDEDISVVEGLANTLLA